MNNYNDQYLDDIIRSNDEQAVLRAIQEKKITPSMLLSAAAKNGSIPFCVMAINNGAKSFGLMLLMAGTYGMFNIIEYAHAYNLVQTFDQAFIGAVGTGRIEICRELIAFPMKDPNKLLIAAAETGDSEACNLALWIGARDIEGMHLHAKAYGHTISI